MCIIMSTHMTNYNHNHIPHMQTITREPANHPRSGLINLMQDNVIDCAHINAQSKDRCVSAESSTCSRAELNTPEPCALVKPSNHSSALISDNCSINPKQKRSGTCHDVINDSDSGRHPGGANYHGHCNSNLRPPSAANFHGDWNTNRFGGSNEELNCANEAVKISAGVYVGDCAGIKVQPLVVCCMCGDAGIAELLFICCKCSHRHQHKYCSRSYPTMGEEASICNWCLHEEDSMISTVTKASDAVTNKPVRASATPTTGTEHHGPVGAHVYVDTQRELGNQVLEDDEVIVKKGHSKAFEYLLLVAAQSLPQHNRAISGAAANVQIKRDKHTKSTTNSNRGSLGVGKVNKDPEIIKANATPLINIVNVGPHVEGKSNSSQHNNKLSCMSLGTHQNMRIHSQVKISIDHKNMDVGRLIRGSIPKRQRCSKGINTSLKCRKKGLQLSPSRPNYRRYKLLADVVC